MKRFVIFSANVQTIDVWKSNVVHTYTLGENRFTDLTDEEYEASLLGGRGADQAMFSG